MVWLLLCVLCCSSLLIFFKMFERYEIDFFQGIVFNYITCAVIGLFFIDFHTVAVKSVHTWLWSAVILGSLFISIFYLSSVTTRYFGITTATLAMKLAVVFPILLGVFFYKDHLNLLKLIGICLAIGAVILCSIKPEDSTITEKKSLLYPLIVWIGSGACDCMVQYSQRTYFPTHDFEFFIQIVFAIAGLWGFVFVLIQRQTLKLKNLIGGIALGIPNYFSMYFIFKAMFALKEEYNISSATFFPINNISIVLMSTLIAVVFFKEKLTKLNYLGLSLGLVATILMFL
jgi:drug/metabolite transporter (DMT)-like permease